MITLLQKKWGFLFPVSVLEIYRKRCNKKSWICLKVYGGYVVSGRMEQEVEK